MAIQNKLLIISLPKPYISPQHGAIITLVGVNFIGILHSNATALFQIFAFVFGFAAFHTAEIILLPKHSFKKLKSWSISYGVLALFSGAILALSHPQILTISIGLTILGSIFLILQRFPSQKTAFHLISFAMLIWLGLCSVNTNNTNLILNLFIQTFLYFIFTVAIIHWRMGKIKSQQLTVLFFSELILCLLFIQWKGIPLLASILTLKAIAIFMFQNYWRKSTLKAIGYEETISLILYIILMSY